jgi:mono/diheme cytochrome c family protein
VPARRPSPVAWLLAAGLCLASGWSSAQLPADPGRGRALYENHCQVCHTQKVHGRANRLPVSRDELRVIVDRWQQAENLRWSGQDISDVVEYLNRSRYGYGETGR